jgi:hypothetical protein
MFFLYIIFLHKEATNISWPSYFGAALVVNLAERADRRRSVEIEFQNVGWTDYRFFTARRFDMMLLQHKSASFVHCVREKRKTPF